MVGQCLSSDFAISELCKQTSSKSYINKRSPSVTCHQVAEQLISQCPADFLALAAQV